MHKIFGYEIVLDPKFYFHGAIKGANKKNKVFVACINPHSFVVAQKNALFEKALKRADLLLVDGAGFWLAAKLIYKKCPQRCTGSDIFEYINGQAARYGLGRVALLGSTDTVLEKLKAEVERRFPHLSVVSTISPSFGCIFPPDENEDIIDQINRVNADILWVGMTAPKQEIWVEANMDRLNVPVIGCVGAVFDFFSGTKKRPGPLVRRFGLEWLGRLISEPGRLWKRSLVSGVMFVLYVLKLSLTKLMRRNCRSTD